MSTATVHADAFYREVAESGVVWAIKDGNGYPAPAGRGGRRAMPFWSSESRARSVIDAVAAYEGFVPIAIPWEVFCERWIPGLMRDGLRAGVNWSGPAATGYDVAPMELKRNVDSRNAAS
jgi:hypothetical protein